MNPFFCLCLFLTPIFVSLCLPVAWGRPGEVWQDNELPCMLQFFTFHSPVTLWRKEWRGRRGSETRSERKGWERHQKTDKVNKGRWKLVREKRRCLSIAFLLSSSFCPCHFPACVNADTLTHTHTQLCNCMWNTAASSWSQKEDGWGKKTKEWREKERDSRTEKCSRGLCNAWFKCRKINFLNKAT